MINCILRVHGTGRDAGRIGLFVAVLIPTLLALVGLGADGARYVRASQRAENIAREAARAGGQVIDFTQSIPGGPHRIDPEPALAATQDYLTAAGVTGTVTVNDDQDQIIITVTITYDPILVDLVPGVGDIAATSTVTAQLLVG